MRLHPEIIKNHVIYKLLQSGGWLWPLTASYQNNGGIYQM